MLFTQNVTIAKEMLFLGNHTEYDHHIHTKHSDGSFSLREVIEFAKQNHFLIGGGSDFHSGPNTIVGFGKKSSPLSICGNEFDWIRKLYI